MSCVGFEVSGDFNLFSGISEVYEVITDVR